MASWIRKASKALRFGGKEPSTPDGVRLYAIGDIHGRADLLRELHSMIAQDVEDLAPESRAIIIYLGDYIDRGHEVPELLDMLSSGPPPGFEAVYLKGNHEAMLLDFLEDATLGIAWRETGGYETLRAYGVTQTTIDINPMHYDAAQTALHNALPEKHLTFLQNLALSATYGDYFFCHAGVRPGVKLDEQKEADLIWIRSKFLESKRNFGKVVVHGHTPSFTEDGRGGVDIKDNQIGIDTGAWMTNILTCLVLDGTESWFLQTGDH